MGIRNARIKSAARLAMQVCHCQSRARYHDLFK